MTGGNRALNVVAVGASAGGVEALTNFAAGLPPDLPYAVVVVLHMPAGAPSVLARIATLHPGSFRNFLDRRWRKIAPKKLVKEYDAKAEA